MSHKVLFLFLLCIVTLHEVTFGQNIEQLTEEIESQVVQLRGLPFLQDVEKIFQAPDELRRVLEREIERTYPGETLQAIEKRLLKFGLS